MCAFASMGGALFAQDDGLKSQINGSFNLEWMADSVGNGALPGQFLRPGLQPQGWEASNVNQKVLMEVKQELVFKDADRTGDAEGASVKMVNTAVGLGSLTSPAPAYITWGGKPWVFAIGDMKACDGGTLGGAEFKYRPDSIVGYYKRTLTDGSNEPAKILAYSWTGEFKSTVRVNPNGGLTSDKTTEIVDQDLAVLGKITEGVSKSENAGLVASCEYSIEGALEDWTRISVPFVYASDKNPEKMNVIISSSNYWNRGDIVAGNILWADDVRLVYNSQLNSLAVKGVAVDGFEKNRYFYEIDDFMPSLADISVVTDGAGATADLSFSGDTVMVTVNGADYKENESNVHIYKLKFTRTVDAEYQLPNFDFEGLWTSNEYVNSEGNATYSEETPEFWNSFYRADGDYAGLALKLMANQAGSVKKTVGYDGKGSAALIFSRQNLMGSVSNGNLTTGIVHMGNYVAADMNNHNYSDLDNSVGHRRFIGLPDSVSAYLKFEPKDKSKGNASMNMILHSEYEYKDPGAAMGTEDSLKYLVASARASVAGDGEWVRYSVPFDYNGENYRTEGNIYLLASFSTNEKPGIGSDGDSLSIDNIRFIYNSRLESLTVGGSEIVGIEGDVYEYEIEDDVPAIEDVVAVADGIGAVVETAVDGNVLTVTVKGNDFSVNPENVHTYTITYNDVTGIGENSADNVCVEYTDGKLTVAGADGENVGVYSLQGVTIAEFVAGDTCYLNFGSDFVCIVKVGDKVFKVVLK